MASFSHRLFFFFFLNYDIGCLPRKALQALPPASRQIKAHRDPGTRSTYHSLTSPDNWVSSSNTIWFVSQSPYFNFGYFGWVRTCLLSWVCFLPGARQPQFFFVFFFFFRLRALTFNLYVMTRWRPVPVLFLETLGSSAPAPWMTGH